MTENPVIGRRVEPAVLLFRGRGWISAAIRWQTRSEYSHAALLDTDGTVIEAWYRGGVRRKELKDWDGIDAFGVTGMDAELWETVLGKARRNIGKKYDFLGVLRFLSRRGHDTDERLFCSELVLRCFFNAGEFLLRRVDPAEVSPGLLSYSPKLYEIWKDTGPWAAAKNE